MIREAIVKLVNKENLTYEMAEGAMDEIMGGKAGTAGRTEAAS